LRAETVGEVGDRRAVERRNCVLVDPLEPGMVLLADRGFTGFALWQQASETGADLVWRARNNVTPRRLKVFEDGSWLGELRANNTKVNTEHVVVRVVDYHLDDGRGTPMGPFRLFTTLVDPDEVTATELAAAYAQRWEIESVFDDSKPTSAAPRWCSGPSPQRSSCKRSGAICAATTRSAP